MAKHMLIVLTNAVEGKEDEFNDWYDNRHLEDVLKLPGVVSAQRFALSDHQRMASPLPWSYFALYEIDTDDLKETVDALSIRSGTVVMPISPAMHADRQAFVVHAITDRRTA